MEQIQKPNYLKTIIFSILGVTLLTATILLYFQNQQLKKQSVKQQISPTIKVPTSSISVKPNETADWKTYKIEAFRIEFKLPSRFTQSDDFGVEVKGEVGTQLCAGFEKKTSGMIQSVLAGGASCFANPLVIGATSSDYEAGRGGGFADLQGYIFENGKYYAKANLNRKYELPGEIVREITNPNGIKILKVAGKNLPPENFSVPGTPGEGYLGGLINNPGDLKYPGTTIHAKISSDLTEELFDQILSGFKFLEPLSVPSPTTLNIKKLNYYLPEGWKTSVDTTGTFEMGYDPQKYRVTSSSLTIGLSYPGSSLIFRILPYDGGSRHQFIYKELGFTSSPPASEKAKNYHELEYLYNGWRCLVIYGLYFSASGTTWGMCPISSSQALFIQGPEDESQTENFIRTIKLIK